MADKKKGPESETKKPTKDRRVLPFRIIDGGRSDDDQNEEDFFLSRSRRKAGDCAKSPIAKAVGKHTLSEEALDAATQSLALIEGQLLFEQEQEELRGFLDLDVVDRRVKVIDKVANLILKRRAAMSKRGLDLHSSQFRMVLGSFLDLIRESMEEDGVHHGKVEAIMVRVADKMENWEDRMQHELTGE